VQPRRGRAERGRLARARPTGRQPRRWSVADLTREGDAVPAVDVVDLDRDEALDDDDADADAVSLLQRDLGAQVIGEIDAV